MFARITFCVLLSCLGCSTAFGQQVVATFTARDYLKSDWQHELVFFPVEKGVFDRDDLALLGPDDQPAPYQWVPGEQAPSGNDSVALFASVPEFGTSTYRLVKGRPTTTTDLKVQESNDTVRIENRLTGIHLGSTAAATAGPIAGIRLRSGRWIGGGQLRSPLPLKTCTVEVLATGPVFADVQVSLEFPNYCYWRLKCRVIAGEPVVLVDEQFTLPEGASYVLDLAKGWNPDQMFYRDAGNTCRTAGLGSLPGDCFFLLEAWPPWWGDVPRGNWTSFCHSGSDDLLAIGCREPGVWVEPGRTDWPATVEFQKPGVRANFQLRGFARKWMLASLSKAESVTEPERVAPLPQQVLMRHGDVALDTVKDYVTEWNDRPTRHPRMYVTQAELDRFRKSFKVDDERLAALRTAKMNPWGPDEHVAYFLATGDVELGRTIAAVAMEKLQDAVDGFARQNRLRNQGSCPHHRTPAVMWSAIFSDLALVPGVLTSDERDRVKGQLAYLGYTLASPAVISPERGYSANPNMTTSARGMLGLVACSIPSHPHARDWAQLAIGEMQRELDTWCGAEGGWLEAPHYMTVSMDALIPLSLALRETGFSDVAWHHHPKLQKTVAWLAKISTPPDPRLGGDRHMPAIGNTYLGERTCLPGWMARIWRDKDPGYAQNMQWMWQAHGSPRSPGIGGAYPGFQGYSSIVFDPSIPARPPRWTSELFPEAGAVFRAHAPGDRETYLYYIQGKMHQHFDYDEGAFILWGKGQPLCEDFAYYGRAPAADHSRVDDGVAETLGSEGRIEEFAAGTVDYLRGQRSGWHRQILFAKDDDPLGPNYFVIRDSVTSGRPADWRVWIATDEPPPVAQNPVRATGRFEADLAVFFADPARPQVTTDQITRRTGASGFETQESTQRCLHLKMPTDQPVAAVLYPVMKDQPTPAFTTLAGGRGVKITGPFGTDYVFLALESFQYSGEGIEFEGKAGAVQIRPKNVRLSLPCRGKLAYQGKTVENATKSNRTASRSFGR